MQRVSRLFLLLVTITLFIAGCAEEETRVIIFHTNDTHAQLDNFAALAFLVDKERETNKHVFLVSAGDIFSGNAIVDHFDPPGYPVIDMMNLVGYDIHTIGNHDFDYGLEVLSERMEQAEFPFILANLDAHKTGLPQPEPYHTLMAGKHRIVFIGLVQLNYQGIPSTHPERIKGIDFFHASEKIPEYSFLADEADMVIGLTHLGFAADTVLAWNNPWLDIIIGGHSHSLTLQPKTYNNVLVSHAGSNLRYTGKISLLFRGNELIEKKAEMISLADTEGKNLRLAELAEEYNDNPSLNRIIGRFLEPIEGKPNIGGFVTDAYRDYGKFDFAFQNYGGIRVFRMEGEITINDIYKMDPFDNELVAMNLTYREMKSLIGNSLSSGNPSLQISGGVIEVYLTNRGRLSDIKIFDSLHNELGHDTEYLVGMPDYIASVFNFDHKDQGTGMGITTAQVVIDYISGLYDINYAGNARSRVVRTESQVFSGN